MNNRADGTPAQPEAPGPDQDDALQLLVQVIESDGRFSRDVSERVRRACRAYVDAAGARGLEECFGWQPRPSERSLARRLQAARRVAALRDAWRLTPDCDPPSTWRRCKRLFDEMAEFEKLYLPGWIETGPTAAASGMRTALFRFYTLSVALDRPPPKSTKALYELLVRAGVARASSGILRE